MVESGSGGEQLVKQQSRGCGKLIRPLCWGVANAPEMANLGITEKASFHEENPPPWEDAQRISWDRFDRPEGAVAQHEGGLGRCAGLRVVLQGGQRPDRRTSSKFSWEGVTWVSKGIGLRKEFRFSSLLKHLLLLEKEGTWEVSSNIRSRSIIFSLLPPLFR